MTDDLHHSMMARAINLAHDAARDGEVPVGAVIYDGQGNIVATGNNRTRRDTDPTAHAEIVAIRAATAASGSIYLTDLHLAVTLEPCAMCAQAISWARLSTLHFGAWDEKTGGTTHGAKVFNHRTCHHKPQVHEGLMATECARILQDFFRARR